MNTILEMLNKAGLRFVEFASPMLIQSSILILILLAADFLLRNKVRATFRYWIWMLVLIKLVLPVSLYSPLSLGSWFGEKIEYANIAQEDIERRVAKSENIINFKSEIRDFRPIEPRVETSESVPSDTHIIKTNPLPASPEHVVTEKPVKLSWQAAAFLTWIAITTALGLVLLKRTVFIKELVTKASDIDIYQNNSISPNDVLNHCCIYLGLKKQIPLKISPDATSPVVCGLLQPVILLPQNLISSLSQGQLKAIFFHEIAHIKRGDLWVNLLQTLLQITYFYNPLLWLANSIIRKTREQAVDEMVLVAMGKDAREYPETLLNVAKLAFKRPALSLRLIGVVESEDALTGRIKHMLSRPWPKNAKLGLLGLLVIVIFAAVMLPMARLAQPKMTVINNGPLDIKLVAICPDGYDLLYDPNGKKLDSKPGAYLPFETTWQADQQCRDFIFEFPETEGQLIFPTFQKIRISENDIYLGGAFRPYYDYSNESLTFVYGSRIQREYRRDVIPFLSTNRPINYIDFTLSYYYGSRKEAQFTFAGPFEYDKAYNADNSSYHVTFSEGSNTLHTNTLMRFVTSQPYQHNTLIILYDKQGKRYVIGNGSGLSGSSGADITYNQIPLTIDEIAYITFGEKPYEITFKNIKINYKELKPRTSPEYIDVMSERLNVSKTSLEQKVRNYTFENPEDVIKVIDVIRGQYISKAVDSLKIGRPRIKIFELDEETQEKIRQAALNWTKHSNIEHYGIELGLMGKWPEFFELAIERLSKNPPDYLSPESERSWRQDNSSIVNQMYNYKLDELNREEITKLKELAQTTDNSTILSNIFYYFQNQKSPAAIDALYEMVQDGRPWLWSKAITLWYPLANDGRLYDTLPDEIKLKRLLTSNNISDEKLDAKADELLRHIFTPEFGKMASSEWDKFRAKIVQRFDKKETTEIFINYLRQVHNETTSRQWIQNEVQPVWNVINIIWNLNLWYEVNIGNIGILEPGRVADVDIEPRTFSEFHNLIAQALDWYDENPDKEPIKLAFAGKVVDTSGNPIANSKLVFTKMEDYVTERGYTNQRRVKVSQITTDSSGQFSVVLDPKEQCYELYVTADEFLTREKIMVDRLVDGRFRFREYNSQQDNIFILQRPGKISGSLLGKDGKPLANTKLNFDISENYTSNDPAKNVITDSEGKFNIEGIPAEPLILSYTKLNQLGQGRDVHLEYGGLCGALVITNKEGQEQSGLILDLSKSVCSLELEVKDTNSEPLKQITLYFETEMPSGTSSKYRRIFYSKDENSDGVYKYYGLPPGNFHLRIYNSDSVQRELNIELSPKKTAIYQVDFSPLSAREQARFNARTLSSEKTDTESASTSQPAPIIGYDVKLNFADPSLRDDSFHSQQSVAFVLSFQQIEGMLAGKGINFISTGQNTWFVIVDHNNLTISEGNVGQKIITESWPSEKTKFEKVITLPLEYSGKKYQCPVYIELQRREHDFPIGNYWFCAYISGRLPSGSGGRIFEIVNLDQQMEFRLKGDGTDKRDAVLGIDINGDGKIDPSATGGEQFSLYEPFTIDSKTYRVTEVDPYLPRVVFREVASESKTNTSASGQSVKPKLTIKSHEANGANKEAEALMGSFQQALKDLDWNKALSLCSNNVQSFAKKYEPLEDFFKDVVPVEKIKALSEVLTFGGSTGPGNRRLAYFCCLQLSEPDIKPQINWEWKLNNTVSGWEIDFKSMPLSVWIDNETNRLNNERIKANERNRILREGLKLTLIPLSESFVIGKPMEFRLELKNISDSPIEFEASEFYLFNNPMTIIGPDNRRVEYISGPVQTSGYSKIIDPNQTIVLEEKYDVTSQYLITSLGTYTFQFTGYDFTVVKSNTVKIEIKEGKISDEDLILQKLIDIAPKNWEITKSRIRDMDDFNIWDKNGISIVMIGDSGRKATSEGPTGIILLINPSQSFLEAIDNEAEFFGQSKWGNIYLNSLNAESLWPDYKEQIVKVLRIETAENSIKQNEEKAKWGDVVEGAQIRIIGAGQIWRRSDWPHAVVQLRLEARNNGQRYLHLPENGLRWQLEVDDIWYEYVKYEQGKDGIELGAGTVLRDFNPGNSYDDLKVEIAGNWRQIPQGKEIEYAMRQYSGSGWVSTGNDYGNELVLKSGKHTIRTAITCPPSKRINIIDSPVRLISNTIEFEINDTEENSNNNTPEIEPLSSSQNSDIYKRILKNEEIDLNLIYELLAGPQSGSRLWAAGYLGTHGDSNSIPYLIDALSDEATVVGIDFFVEENSDLRMNTVRYWANDSLKKLTGLDVGFVWNDPIEKRNKAIQKWKYWWEKNESTFKVINNNDREEIENIVESLWQAVDANDTKKVSQLYYDKIIDNNDSNTNGLIYGLLKDKEQVEKQKENDIASISNIVIKNNLAIAVTKPNIELFVYYFVKLNDKWFLYYTERRTNLSKIIDLEPTIAINDLFNNWPQTKLDNEAFSAYLEVGELLYNGTDREEVAKKFKSIGELYPLTDRGKICTELGTMLNEMVQEDKEFVEPQDINQISEQEKIDYYIYKLRDVAEREMFIPGKCFVLRYPRTPNSAAVALRNMGSVVIPSMISLLEDRRPTRSVGLSRNGGVVLRYCDIALEIIADIAGQNKPNATTTFDPRTQRGTYLSNADEKIAREIIDRAKSWWEQNKEKYD